MNNATSNESSTTHLDSGDYSTKSTHEELRRHAFKYGTEGWYIFPLKVESKEPLPMSHGFKDATTCMDTIGRHWETKPRNIGLATGKVNSIMVVDVDNEALFLEFLEKQEQTFPDGLRVKTNKGFHAYFQYSKGHDIGSRTFPALGFDIRGNGGYVLAPPSNHPAGGVYDFIGTGSLSGLKELQEPPQWLVDFLVKPKDLAKPKHTANTALDYKAPISVSSGTTPFGRGGLNGEIAALRITGEGARNAQLNTAAFSIGQLVAGGEVTESDARTELEAAASSIGLTPQEIKPTLNSGLKAGKLKHRSAPPKEGDITPVDNSAPTISAQERLQAFTANGLSGDMKRQMLEDKYVVDGIALLGQWTTIYASPSSGKTLIILHELMESVSNGVIKGEDVFYVNVDDSYKGQTNKLKLLEEVGIQALIPNQRGFKASALLPLMEELTREGTAKEKTFILDTMKKFTDLMDKKMATDFGNIARGFVQAGGTLICLAHTNKHKDAEGKSVHAGTSDIVDDCDCAYIIEASAPDHSGKRRAKFKNIKSRGNVAQKVTFEYTVIEGSDYEALLNSVKRLDDKDAKVADKETKQLNDIVEDKDLVDAIRLELESEDGGLNSKELVKAVMEATTYSRNKTMDAMKKWQGTDYDAGHRWTVEKVGKRELLYKNLDNPAEKAGEAMLAKARLRGDIKDPRDIMGGFSVDDYDPADYRDA